MDAIGKSIEEIKVHSQNSGYIQCLSDLNRFIFETTDGNDKTTADEIKKFFIIPKLEECNKKSKA